MSLSDEIIKNEIPILLSRNQLKNRCTHLRVISLISSDDRRTADIQWKIMKNKIHNTISDDTMKIYNQKDHYYIIAVEMPVV